MQRNLKKMWPTLAVSFIAFTGLANAQTDNAQMRNLENRVSALEQRRGSSGMINPPGRPQVKGGADLFVFADLLYWNAHENMSFAVKNADSSTNLSDATIKNIHGKWNWGFRVGAGYNLPHDGWDLSLTWLRFTDNGVKHANAGDEHFIFPTDTHPADPLASGRSAKRSRADWHLNLNQLDLDLGREFFVSKWLTVRPHAGLRSDWVHQKGETVFKNFSGTATPNQMEAEWRDHWYGFGLEGGLDTQWGLGSGFSIYANLATSIIYGFHKFNIEQEDSTSGTDFVGIEDNSYRISHPTLDMAMGARYDFMFSDDRFHLGVQLGWENHVYFSQNQVPHFTSSTSLGTMVRNQGDLSLQGWTLAARFDF